ncbi:hypothetical protein M2360_004587 [Rhizobium sp. SG_E_25_P2]|jgi:hypothetical protein|uniref:hypothetical protein n=1 Tax=Rhizobium sp. SG_E_25_P2 TaxID=2879942 RepID=UPI002474A684|nr:hypothetical protein [Rhizobium sp. SG_E_25_P2]MDH6269161.1 hypothetical protein [Rhizobium sp. SG_E_25_P2]
MSVTYSTLYGSDADDALSPTYTVDGDVVDVHSTIYGGGNVLESKNMTARDLSVRYVTF